MVHKRKLVLFATLTVLLPLILGGAIYYLLSPQVFFVQILDGFLGIKRIEPIVALSKLPAGIRYYFTDFLWAFALCGAVFLITKDSRYAIPACLISSIGLGICLELCQSSGIVSGTFDLGDIAAEGLGSLCEAIIIIYFWRDIDEKENKVD